MHHVCALRCAHISRGGGDDDDDDSRFASTSLIAEHTHDATQQRQARNYLRSAYLVCSVRMRDDHRGLASAVRARARASTPSTSGRACHASFVLQKYYSSICCATKEIQCALALLACAILHKRRNGSKFVITATLCSLFDARAACMSHRCSLRRRPQLLLQWSLCLASVCFVVAACESCATKQVLVHDARCCCC